MGTSALRLLSWCVTLVFAQSVHGCSDDFIAIQTEVVPYIGRYVGSAMAFSDIDGDGFLDVAFVASDDGVVSWRSNIYGNGTFVVAEDGNYDEGSGENTLLESSGHGVIQVMFADLDNDFTMELLVAYERANGVSWYTRGVGVVNYTFVDSFNAGLETYINEVSVFLVHL